MKRSKLLWESRRQIFIVYVHGLMQPNFPLALCARRVSVLCLTCSWKLHFDSSIYADSLNNTPKSIHTYIPPGLVGIRNPTRSIRHMVVFLTRNVDSYWIVLNGIRGAEWMMQNVSFRWRMRIESEHRFTLDLCSVTFGSPSCLHGRVHHSAGGFGWLTSVLCGIAWHKFGSRWDHSVDRQR